MFNSQRVEFVLIFVMLAVNISVADLNKGLVAYWSFNGDANDYSGNGNHGVVHGAILTTDRYDRTDRAYYFDGADDYIVASANELPTAERTVSLWFYTEAINRNSSGIGHRPAFIGYGGSSCGTSWLMGLCQWGYQIMGVTSHCDIKTAEYSYESEPVGRWYNFVIITTGTGTDIYVNGHLKHSSLVFFNDTYVVDRDIAIGTSVTPSGYAPYQDENIGYFKGKIDDVRIYNRALSPKEVQDLYDGLETTLNVIFVDDDAVDDPGPYDSTISDPLENGTRSHPFDMIQEGIDAAEDGYTVIVMEGTYRETIDFKGKNIKVTGFDPNLPDEQIQPYPVIDGNNQGPVVNFINGENASTSLSGFTITRGLNDLGSAVLCVGSHPVISNCLIIGNRTNDPNFGAAVYCVDSNSIIENCTIADNYTGQSGAGIYLVESNVGISNTIVWGNTPEKILIETGNGPNVTYSDIQGTWPGEGNIDADPVFANAGYWASSINPEEAVIDLNDPDVVWIDGDYHLMSRGGRWDPIISDWVIDENMSPCIDAGDPASPWEAEPEPNGERVNIGAYGGTSQASISWESDICTLLISSTEGGSVTTPGEGTFEYNCGDLIPVEAAPETCYHFTHWSGTAVEAGKVTNPNAAGTTVLVDGEYTLMANFALSQCVLTISSGPGGSVTTPGEGVFTFDCGAQIVVEAAPDSCYVFSHWSGTLVDAGIVTDPYVPGITFSCNGEYTLIANFISAEYDLIISSGAGGSVTTPGEGTFTYDCNTIVPIVAAPEPCYSFSHWSGTAVDAGKVDDPLSSDTMVIVDADYTLVANFTVLEYSLTISSSDGGSVTVPGEGIFKYDCGANVSVEAAPESCYRFTHWSGTAVDAGKVDDPLDPNTMVTIDADYTLVANFALIENVVLIISSGSGGSVTTPGEGTFIYNCNAQVAVEATSEEGYNFLKWTGTAVDAGKVANPNSASTTVTVDGDYSLIANFSPVCHTITVSSTSGGSVTSPGEGEFTYCYNLFVPIEATADEHYHFVGWSGSAVNNFKVGYPSRASTTVLVDGDYDLMANFEIDKFTLTTSSTSGGSVTTPGEETKEYAYGQIVNLVATPDTKYRFVGWTGPVADASSASTTVTITENITVEAIFEIKK